MKVFFLLSFVLLCNAQDDDDFIDFTKVNNKDSGDPGNIYDDSIENEIKTLTSNEVIMSLIYRMKSRRKKGY